MPDRAGQSLGNYRLVRLLGRGGFAEVYLGEHRRLGSQAAIKILYTHTEGAEEDEFLAEARTIARLVHPHIVRILDFDVEDGTPFLVMDYAPNGNLRQRHPKGTRLPLATVSEYIKQVADALQYAHDEKVIHRDIKPENMLVGRRNEIFLSDFGIALIAQSSRLQSTQEVVGTAMYMAPEQLQGKPRLASDQYALGIVIYEWLTGDRPFHGGFVELYSQHLNVPPPPLRTKAPDISPDLDRVVLTALAKDPAQRFASIKAFANALEQAIHLPITPAIIRPSVPDNISTKVARDDTLLSMPIALHDIQALNSPIPIIEPSHPVSPNATGQPLLTTPPSSKRMIQGASRPMSKKGLSRRGIIIGAAVLTVTAAIGEGVWLLLPKQQPQLPQKPQSTLSKGPALYTYRGHSNAINSVKWSPDGTRIASASSDNTVQVWNATNGNTLFTYKNHSLPVLAIAWSSDSTRVASASSDNTVQVWNATNGNSIFTYKGHVGSVYAVTWAPDGTRIASASNDNTVQVWNAANGSSPFTYKGHSSPVYAVAWSPDSTRIVSGSGDNTAQVWNATDGSSPFTYKGHSNSVYAVAWAPNGNYIASSSADKTAQVWIIFAGTFHYIYKGHSSSVNSVTWSRDSKYIASGSDDNTAQLWPTPYL